jgi:phosphoribosylaminoimidazole-succinocarboxamide synthase
MYTSDQPGQLVMVFRDDMTAFNGEKKEAFEGKGAVNHRITHHLMNHLESMGIKTHYRSYVDETQCLVSALKMLPIECVIRNVAAGGFAKRFGVPVGEVLKTPIYELFYKHDGLGDPMIRDEHALYFGWATEQQLADMKAITFRVNAVLSERFLSCGMTLVDFKLEFGLLGNELLVADEISPDSCRIWDNKTQEIMDKDRFRKDLGGVVEHYHKIAQRLGV